MTNILFSVFADIKKLSKHLWSFPFIEFGIGESLGSGRAQSMTRDRLASRRPTFMNLRDYDLIRVRYRDKNNLLAK